jgi:hypothetical protein
MQVYRLETTVASDGTLSIKGLSFVAGEHVEVIVRRYKKGKGAGQCYSLRGKPFRYIDPFDSVAEDDWETIE